jgi:mono/diheme cytochrome c family protein
MRILITIVMTMFATAATAQQQQPAFKPIADAKQLMHAIVIPMSNVVFRVEVEAPKDDKEWETVQNAALALAEAGNLLMIPGRAKDNAEWMKRAESLIDVSVKAKKAADEKDADAVIKIGYEIFDVCAACHDQYMPARILRRQQQQRQQQQQQQQ